MASIDELKSVLKDSLEKRGVLNQLKSRLRAEIYSSLEDNNNEQIPKLPHENLLINELIREYLEFNEYKYTNSVFSKESGQPTNLLSRDIVVTELGLKESQVSKQMPVIYSLLWHFLNNDDYLGQTGINNKNNDNEEPKINVYKYKTEHDD